MFTTITQNLTTYKSRIPLAVHYCNPSKQWWERERKRRGSPGCDEREIGVARLCRRLKVASLALLLLLGGFYSPLHCLLCHASHIGWVIGKSESVIKNLQHLDMEYVDFIYCQRPDVQTPIEETVRAMNYVIDKGWAFYWGTSEWSAQQITEAWGMAQRLDLMGPIVEQPEYNLLSRHKVCLSLNLNCFIFGASHYHILGVS